MGHPACAGACATGERRRRIGRWYGLSSTCRVLLLEPWTDKQVNAGCRVPLQTFANVLSPGLRPHCCCCCGVAAVCMALQVYNYLA